MDASPHPAFTDVLRRSRFTPAELRGPKGGQLVSQPLVFRLRE
ncbi:MAG TPA: hypothetical protein VJ802_12100 [Gemmatimonadaceae bacterium]|nr:hypothetical protein [Gemmatimonadaceae bacterium]